MKIDLKRRWKICVVTGAAMALVAGMASTVPSAYAGGTIKVDDDKFISVGMGTRLSFNAVEDGSASHGQYSNSFGVNNARIYINGGIHKYVKFAFNTECFNCSVGAGNGNGSAGNSFGSNATIGLLDAVAQFEFNELVNFWIGRTLVPTERGELNGPYYHAVFDGFRTPFNQADFSGNFGAGGAGIYGRDNGAVFYGKIHPGGTHLQYVASVFTGLQSSSTAGPNQRNSLKYAGRLTWNLLNDESNPGYYTSGTYYGTAGDILALAVGGEYQNDGAGSFANRSRFGLRSMLSSNGIGRRTSRHLGTQTASACLPERHGPGTPSICFRRKSESGDFSPMQDIPARTVSSAAHVKNLNLARTMSLPATMRASRRTGGLALSATAAPLTGRT
jgi:hypothetical protein